MVGNDVPYRLGGASSLSFQVRMRLRATRYADEPAPWSFAIVAYQYTLLDQGQRELLAFHLHPDGPSHVTTPHLHLGAGAGELRADLARAHLPTGFVTLAAVTRLTIEGFGANPTRAVWDMILDRAEQVLGAASAAT